MKTYYEMGRRMTGFDGPRFSIAETDGHVSEVYDRDGDFFSTVIPDRFSGPGGFETVHGERFEVRTNLSAAAPNRHLVKLNQERYEDTATAHADGAA